LDSEATFGGGRGGGEEDDDYDDDDGGGGRKGYIPMMDGTLSFETLVPI
jgi:hypothetical protein